MKRRPTLILSIALFLGCVSCVSQTVESTVRDDGPATNDSGTPYELVEPYSGTPYELVEPSQCNEPGWARRHMVATSSDELFYIHLNNDVQALRADGEEVWGWKLRDFQGGGARTKLAIVIDPAFPFAVKDHELLFLSGTKLGLFDAATGEEIVVDRSFRDTLWGPDLVELGQATVWYTQDAVHVTRDSGEDAIADAELYACGDGPDVLIVTGDGEYMTVTDDGSIEAANLRRHTEGKPIGYYVSTPGTFHEVVYHERTIYDGERCWRNKDRPPTVRPNYWPDYQPNYVTTTKYGHGYSSSLARFVGGTFQFLPFDQPRDVQPCRRVTKTPVLPDIER